MVVPEFRILPTTTPCKDGKVGDLRRSTTLYELWGRINQKKKEKAFELWTSPAAPEVPVIRGYLEEDDLIHDSPAYSVDDHAVSQGGDQKGDDDQTAVPSGGLTTQQTPGKAFYIHNTNLTILAPPNVNPETDNDSQMSRRFLK